LYIRNHPERFQIENVVNGEDLSGLRWTVDQREDLEFVRAVYANLGEPAFSMADVVLLLQRHPELREMNAHFKRNEGIAKSVREDHLV
jgi:spore coat polysaccharide biosynthesis protein SpsF (cytidylyltransferase family)